MQDNEKNQTTSMPENSCTCSDNNNETEKGHKPENIHYAQPPHMPGSTYPGYAPQFSGHPQPVPPYGNPYMQPGQYGCNPGFDNRTMPFPQNSPGFGYSNPVPGQQPGYPPYAPDQGFSEHPHSGSCSCGSHPSPQNFSADPGYAPGQPPLGHAPGQGTDHQPHHPKHDAWRYGQWLDVVNGIASGSPDINKIAGLMEEYDNQFWKGLLIGGVAAVILTSDTVKETLSGALGAAWGMFQKDKNDQKTGNDTQKQEEVKDQ